jgi:regulator of protease activity HflC (stomatin/prohibitin superfamily)
MVEQNVLIGIGTVVVLIIAYIALSFSSLEYNEYGLDYSTIWKTVGTSVYSGGIHFIGFQHSFIKFPKSVQTIEFSSADDADGDIIQSRTSDGLEVNLEISFQYELQPAGLYSLYMNYSEDYQGFLINRAIDVVNKVSNTYTAYDFFLNRTDIANVMDQQLGSGFKQDLGISIKFFQLKDVDLPNSFEDAIQQTEVKKQDIEKAKAERNKVTVEIETKIQKAQQNTQIILNQAGGTANATTSANKAQVKAFNYTERNVVDGYNTLKESAGLDNGGLLDYIRANIIANYEGEHLIVSLD